jgi:hypothetical protein
VRGSSLKPCNGKGRNHSDNTFLFGSCPISIIFPITSAYPSGHVDSRDISLMAVKREPAGSLQKNVEVMSL